MTIWIISDTHLFHNNIKKYCGRPQNAEELIKENWLKNVKEDDLVFHLGDVSWPKGWKLENWNWKELPGTKVLVRGNHDTKPNTWYKDHGFDFCCESFVLKFRDLKILFSHEPYPNHMYDINVHGHLHTVETVPDAPSPLYSVCIEKNGTNFNLLRLDLLYPFLKKIIKEHKEREYDGSEGK